MVEIANSRVSQADKAKLAEAVQDIAEGLAELKDIQARLRTALANLWQLAGKAEKK